METPCIRHCTLNEQDVCVGCKRTLQEIMGWTAMTDAERRAVMDDLPTRSISRPLA